ncbi:Inner membrane protein YjcH [compost metagenome]
MNQPDLSHAQSCDRIRANPKFQKLVQSRSRLAWTLTATVLGAYYLFMLVVAFFPQWLHTPLGEGRALTVGMPVAAAIIVLSWLLTGWYVRSANTRFDALNAELIEESQQ